MTRRAIAWDIDGTLVDSEPRHHRALLAASRRWDVDLTDLPDQAFRGIHMIDVWAELACRYPSGLTLEEWLAAINAEYVNDRHRMPTIPGAADVICELAQRGVAQVCVSNSNRMIVEANIDVLGIRDCLAGIITLDDVSSGKPDPEPYLKACDLLGLGPSDVVAVEDSLSGVSSAVAAGLQVIGYCPTGSAIEGANWIIHDLLEVLRSFPGNDAAQNESYTGAV